MKTSSIKREFPYSWHRTGWEGQLARVSRWFDRLIRTEKPEDTEDFLYAFFQNCYHVRDWLPEDLFSRAQVDAFINGHRAMRVCRDVANMAKHYELTRPPAQTYEPSILREYVGPGRGWFEVDSRLVIVTNDGKNGVVLDARDVARECLALWCEFLPACDVVAQVSLYFGFPNRLRGPPDAEIQVAQRALPVTGSQGILEDVPLFLGDIRERA